MALNAGRKFGTLNGASSWFQVCGEALGPVDIAYVPEYDGSGEAVAEQGWEFLALRHWPGEGSRSMAFLVRRTLMRQVRWRCWRGRCGALFLEGADGASLFVVGFHGAHGDMAAQGLADLREILACRPHGSQFIVIGDFNIDLLPVSAVDAWSDRDGRASKHREERVLLESLREHLHATVSTAEFAMGAPLTIWAQEVLETVATRIGMQPGPFEDIPSILDYTLHSADLMIERLFVSWDLCVADHAAVIVELPMAATQLSEKKKHTWQPDDWLAAECSAAELDVEAWAGADVMESWRQWSFWTAVVQDLHQQQHTVKERKRQRIPFQARELLRQSNRAAELGELRLAKQLKDKAWQLVWQRREEERLRKLRASLKRGGVLHKDCGLKKIEAVTMDNENDKEVEVRRWLPLVRGFFEKQWGE